MLYVVPTPIGNLADLTFRAVEVLRDVDYILAEDTRTTGKLLTHYNISNEVRSYHAHNEHRITPRVIEDLRAGQNIAIVSDAGTPGISDPGYLLVHAALETDLPVTCLPGANSIIPAIVLSGFPSDRFSFEGFLPHKKGRQKRWQELGQKSETTVIFESPHRLLRFLKEANEHLAQDRLLAVIREISKMHESVHRGTAAELLDFFSKNSDKVRGELVIVISRYAEK